MPLNFDEVPRAAMWRLDGREILLVGDDTGPWRPAHLPGVCRVDVLTGERLP